jgi:hypothetical protein
MNNDAFLRALADVIAAEVIAKAMLLRAKAGRKGESLSRIDAINLALETMAEEMEGRDNG